MGKRPVQTVLQSNTMFIDYLDYFSFFFFIPPFPELMAFSWNTIEIICLSLLSVTEFSHLPVFWAYLLIWGLVEHKVFLRTKSIQKYPQKKGPACPASLSSCVPVSPRPPLVFSLPHVSCLSFLSLFL